MDITSVLGVVLGIVAILVGMVLKGVSVTALINPAAILIIIVGTFAAVVTAVMEEIVVTWVQVLMSGIEYQTFCSCRKCKNDIIIE